MRSSRYDPDQPVPVVLAPNDFEAQVAAHALNAEGVRATVSGMHAQLWIGAGNPLAPVSVMVRRADRMQALRVLRRLRAEARGYAVPDDAPIRAIDDAGKCVVCGYDMAGLEDRLVCPECGTNLADDAVVFHAAADGRILRSASLRILIVLLILAAMVVGIIAGVDALVR